MSRVLVGFVLILVVGCTKPEPAPEASTAVTPRHLMTELVYTQYGRLLEGLREQPADDDTWDRCATHAALLSEAGEMLLRPGSSDDDSWRIAATALHDGGGEILEAVRAHDLERARASFETVNESCASCHHECSGGYPVPWK